jgi:hypothetical protein
MDIEYVTEAGSNAAFGFFFASTIKSQARRSGNSK